jgi:hypothetical protein
MIMLVVVVAADKWKGNHGKQNSLCPPFPSGSSLASLELIIRLMGLLLTELC